MTLFIILCAVIGAISLIAFIFYGADKRAAIKGAWRTPERVLLSLSFFGGAVGGILGMSLFRHKTKKPLFIAVNAIGLIWQAIAVAAAAFYLL